jgi:hypothetical protein
MLQDAPGEGGAQGGTVRAAGPEHGLQAHRVIDASPFIQVKVPVHDDPEPALERIGLPAAETVEIGIVIGRIEKSRLHGHHVGPVEVYGDRLRRRAPVTGVLEAERDGMGREIMEVKVV